MSKKITDEQVISCLLESKTKTEAMQKLQISAKTLYKRMNDKIFIEKYERAKRGILESVRDKLQGEMLTASETLSEIMKNGDTAPQIRVNAAQAVLAFGLKVSEMADFEERLRRLEERGATNEE